MAPPKRPARPGSSVKGKRGQRVAGPGVGSERATSAKAERSKSAVEDEAPTPWDGGDKDLPLLDQVQELVSKQKELMALELEEAKDQALHWKRQFEQLSAAAATRQQKQHDKTTHVQTSQTRVGHPLTHRELLRLPLDVTTQCILRNLDVLDLSGEPLKLTDLEVAIKRLPRLARSAGLSLARSELGDDAARTLQKLLEFSFVSVDLSSNDLGPVGLAAVLTALPRRGTIVRLNLEANQPLASTPLIGEKLGNFVADAYRFAPNLHSLRVTLNDYLSPAGGKGKASSGGGAGKGERRGKNPLNALQFVRMLRRADGMSLGDLGLVGARLSLETTKQLAFLLGERPGQSITNLDLSYAFLGLAGAKALAGALRRPSCPLTGLHLPHNAIGSGGAEAICKALLQAKNESLTTLNLRANQITDSGGEVLRQLVLSTPTLTLLDVTHNELGGRASSRLAAASMSSASLCRVRGLDCSMAEQVKLGVHLYETRKQLRAGEPFFENMEEKAVENANGTTTTDGFLEVYHFVVPSPPSDESALKLVVECELSRKDGGLFLWRLVRQRNTPTRTVESRRVMLTGGAEGASGWMPRGQTLFLRGMIGLDALRAERGRGQDELNEEEDEEDKSEGGSTGNAEESGGAWVVSVEVQACGDNYKQLPAKEVQQMNSYVVRGLRVSWCPHWCISSPAVGNCPLPLYTSTTNHMLEENQEVGMFDQTLSAADTAAVEAEREFLGPALGLSSSAEWVCLRRVFLPKATSSLGAAVSLRALPLSSSAAKALARIEWCLVRSSPFTLDYRVLSNGEFTLVEGLEALNLPSAPRLWRWNRLQLEQGLTSVVSDAGDTISLWICAFDDQRRPVGRGDVVIEAREFQLEFADHVADLPAIAQGAVTLYSPLEMAKKSTVGSPQLLNFDRNSLPLSMCPASELAWQ